MCSSSSPTSTPSLSSTAPSADSAPPIGTAHTTRARHTHDRTRRTQQLIARAMYASVHETALVAGAGLLSMAPQVLVYQLYPSSSLTPGGEHHQWPGGWKTSFRSTLRCSCSAGYQVHHTRIVCCVCVCVCGGACACAVVRVRVRPVACAHGSSLTAPYRVGQRVCVEHLPAQVLYIDRRAGAHRLARTQRRLWRHQLLYRHSLCPPSPPHPFHVH